MKTLFLYVDTELNTYFFEKEGDFSHLDGIFINSSYDDRKVDELNKILEESPLQLNKPSKDWDFFVTCGFVF